MWMMTCDMCVQSPDFMFFVLTSNSRLVGPRIGLTCRTTPAWEETWTQKRWQLSVWTIKGGGREGLVGGWYSFILTQNKPIVVARFHIKMEAELVLDLHFKFDVGSTGAETWLSHHVCPQEDQVWWKKRAYSSTSANTTKLQIELWPRN